MNKREGPRFPGDDNGEEPEPMEFTRKCRGRIKRDSILVNDTRNMNMSMFRVISIEALNHLGKACDEIDRLTAKREHLLEKVALQSKEIERLKAEEKYLNEEVARGIRFNERLEAELEAKIERMTEALEHIVEYWNKDQNNGAMSDALDEILATAEQALKENDG